MTCGREKNCSGARPCVLFQPRVELPIRALCGKVTAVGLGARPCVLFQHRVELTTHPCSMWKSHCSGARPCVLFQHRVQEKNFYIPYIPTYNNIPEINIT